MIMMNGKGGYMGLSSFRRDNEGIPRKDEIVILMNGDSGDNETENIGGIGDGGQDKSVKSELSSEG